MLRAIHKEINFEICNYLDEFWVSLTPVNIDEILIDGSHNKFMLMLENRCYNGNNTYNFCYGDWLYGNSLDLSCLLLRFYIGV